MEKTLPLPLCLMSLPLFLFTACSTVKTVKPEPAQNLSKHLAVWAGDEDGEEPDFLAILDIDPASATYGKVLRTAQVPAVPGAHLLAKTGFNGTPEDFPSSRLNEAHHVNEHLTEDFSLFAGGLISGNVFRFDLKDPLNIPTPELVITYSPHMAFSAPDDFYPLSDGKLLATFMGSGGGTVPPALTTPGGLVEFSPDGRFFAEHPAVLPGGPPHYRTGEDTGLLANPHGLDLREDLNLIITSDFADPVSLATANIIEPKQMFRSTVRIWDLKERKVRKVVQVPDGPRREGKLTSEEPEGLMMVRLLHGKNKGAFTASMNGGTLYYSPDVTVESPEFKEVFDFGASAGISVFAVTSDDGYLIAPVSGLLAPGDEGYDEAIHSRRVVQLDIRKLIVAGQGFKCSGDNLDSPDCPKVVAEINADSDRNFETRGGPHLVALEKGDGRFVFVNYFVDLSHGFGMPGTGSCGDHRLYMVKREGERLVIDESFRDEVDGEVGVSFRREEWPHGKTGAAKPHGMAFR